MDDPGLYATIFRRRDVRGQFSQEPLDDAILVRVLSAAHAAPSVGLSQPWDFVVVTDDRSVLTGPAPLDEWELELPASRWLPTDERGIPSGPAEDVAGTQFDSLPAGAWEPK